MNKLYENHKLDYFIIALIGIILITGSLYVVMGPVISVCCFLFLSLTIYLLKSIIFSDYQVKYIIFTGSIIAVSISIFLGDLFIPEHLGYSIIIKYFFDGGMALYIFALISRLLIIFKTRFNSKNGVELCRGLTITLLYLFITFLIILPCSSMFKNVEEYIIPVQDIIIANTPYVIGFVSAFYILISILGRKISQFIVFVLSGLGMGMYIQYMFLNSNIGTLNGFSYDWRNYPVYAVFDFIVWIIVLCIPFVIHFVMNKKAEGFTAIKFCTYVCGFLLCLLTTGTLFQGFTAGKLAYVYKNYVYDSEEQYVVSSRKNVILFCLDAVDNVFIKEIFENNPEVFDEFNDFTLYTNTCSVYDYTTNSLPQMLTGYYEGHLVDNTDIFYGRLKNADYRINFYNYNALSTYPDIRKYIDNNISVEMDDESTYTVLYNEITINSVLLSLYQTLPCYFKNYIDANDIDFRHLINYHSAGKLMDSENNEFERNLHLTKADNDDNYFIFQHIDGAHFPCDDYIGETKHCLNIMKEYINQLKEMGVYDDAVIIICADHGIHDNTPTEVFPTPATPMFMIKESGVNKDNMTLSDAPVYHTDILSTILVNTGLFNDNTDYELFGTSIYDHYEGEQRERTWYDSKIEGGGVYKYTYTGSTIDLENAVYNGLYTEE